jgi:hypothetical protein
VRVLRLFGAFLALSLMAAVSAFAQSPTAPSASQLPLHGFIPPFEILRTVRAAGFDPLAPPLRQGTIYVVRAIDFRGVTMRVVVDARSGVIRDANRIIPGPGLYGPYALGPNAVGPYASAPYAPGPYQPAHYARLPPPPLGPADERILYGAPPHTVEIPSDDPDELRGPPLHVPASANMLVPLPRPRPARLTPTDAIEPKATSKPDVAAGLPPPAPSDGSSKAANGAALPPIND